MKSSKVGIIKTNPGSVVNDYGRLLDLIDYTKHLNRLKETVLKINISWHHWYPACSTTPWQLEGVIKKLIDDGYEKESIHGCHNRTVVVSAKKGERSNKHKNVTEKYGIENIHLYEPDQEWVDIREAVGDAADDFLVLNEVYPDGFRIPKSLIDTNIIQMPTVKTHVFTTITGAMKNAFGGLLNEKRHWTHSVIHETLVDLLMIQKIIHTGLIAVMDGTIAGDGPGPRCMVPREKDVILASDDQVAVDAVSAYMMGYDPLKDIKFIRLAHEMGLGCGDIDKIEIAGDRGLLGKRWNFTGPFRKMTFASRMQHKIYWGPLKRPVEWSLKTWLAPWSYIASILYHDYYWYPFIGKKRVKETLATKWGELFKTY